MKFVKCVNESVIMLLERIRELFRCPRVKMDASQGQVDTRGIPGRKYNDSHGILYHIIIEVGGKQCPCDLCFDVAYCPGITGEAWTTAIWSALNDEDLQTEF